MDAPAMEAVSLASRGVGRIVDGLRGPLGDFRAVALARLARLLVDGCALKVEVDAASDE